MSQALAAALFSGLASCLREIDLRGWLREGRIAAVVLAQDRGPIRDAARQVAERVARSFDPGVAGLLRVRAIELRRQSRC